MHPFSCIYDPLTIQLKQISTQFQIYLHQSFVENFFTHTVSWLGNEELVTAYILCNIILWCNK